METKSITKFKWFWAWQDEQEEAWLSEMAQQGYHLEKLIFPTIYQFAVREPSEVVYRLDYPNLSKKDKVSYLQLFRDSGWDYIGDQGGWVYFRRQIQPGDPTEIFTDVESKIAKYQRVLTYLIILLPIGIVLRPDIPTQGSTWLQNVIFFLYIGIALLWALAIIKLNGRIKQLQNSG
jgi:hypothetical protein